METEMLDAAKETTWSCVLARVTADILPEARARVYMCVCVRTRALKGKLYQLRILYLTKAAFKMK